MKFPIQLWHNEFVPSYGDGWPKLCIISLQAAISDLLNLQFFLHLLAKILW